LLIVGRDSREQEYKDFAEKLGVAERCIFFGESKQPELFFTMADCYVLPTHYEPFGFTAIEALSCGIPVITTENCGAKEVLDSQVSTVIGGQVDPLELSQAMSKWRPHFNSDLLRGKCRAVAMKQDSKVVLEANYQKLMELYELKCAQESITAS
jgi:UDP-glucose:(heptosyl)LPS alpha-1,3-glucosyltransferase